MAKTEATHTPQLLEALKGVVAAACFGDHDNIKDGAYICLACTSPEIKAAYAAIEKVKP